jgi:hypothetical protein
VQCACCRRCRGVCVIASTDGRADPYRLCPQAACKLFLHFTRNMDDMHRDIMQRLKVPLITQMASGAPELAFAIMHHLQLLLAKTPDLLCALWSG